MTPRRRCLVGLGLGGWVTARARAVGAPPPGQRRLGVLSYDQEHGAGWPQLRPALAALGWGEGKNLRTAWHYANRDALRLAALAAALVRSGVDAVLTNGSTTTRFLDCQDGQGARPGHPASAAATRRRGDRVTRRLAATTASAPRPRALAQTINSYPSSRLATRGPRQIRSLMPTDCLAENAATSGYVVKNSGARRDKKVIG